MEFAHGRIRDRFYIISTDREEEEQVDQVSRHPPLINPSSSSSPAAAAAENSAVVVEKEHMFDKVVTPSDVGKLNRLVIPKQHAEKYFPLDTAANEKGLLLSFEDRTGKPWRFRYSYWNSSQSYVMTKGWSRFVKEKGLDAGDTVSFGRGVGEAARHRLFIDWKRQPQRRVVVPPRIPLPGFSFARFAGPWSGRLFVPPAATAAACGNNWQSSVAGGGQRLYFTLPTTPRPPRREVQQVLDSVPPLGGHDEAAAVKRVRLFGVNLDCPESDCDTNHQNKSLRTALETPVSSSSMSKKQRSLLDLYL